MKFSENLKIFRSEKQLTQEKLAELLNVSRQAVSKWESGQGYPEVDKLVKLSEILEVSLDELMIEPPNQLNSQPNQNTTNEPTSKVEKQTVSLYSIEVDPAIALKVFWGGTMLGAFAAATYYFTS